MVASLFATLRSSLLLGEECSRAGLKEMAALRVLLLSKPGAHKTKPVKQEVPSQDLPPVRAYRPRKTYSGSPDRNAPYRLLWVKVIIRAAYDYALWKDSKDLRHRKFAEDARKWLFDPSELEFGLSNICEVWGLPITKIRKFARELTKEDVKKLEFKERQGRDLIQGSLPERVAG